MAHVQTNPVHDFERAFPGTDYLHKLGAGQLMDPQASSTRRFCSTLARALLLRW